MTQETLITSDLQEQEDIVDVALFAEKGIKPPKEKKYRILVDQHSHIFTKERVTGFEILKETGHVPVKCFSLYQKLKGCDFEKISLDEVVDLTKTGIERFVTKGPEVFNYTLDAEPEMTDKSQMTPNEILKAGGLNPSDYFLVQVLDDGTQKSYQSIPEEPIEMICAGMQFVSVFSGPMPVS